MVTFSVIIPTYNRKHVLRHVLLSLSKQQNVKDFEVIVCDDGSNDGTYEMLNILKSSLQYPLLYQRQERTVFRAGQARNMGLRIAQGQKIVFIDHDVICSYNVLEKLSKVYENFIFVGIKKLVPLDFYNSKINDDVILNNFSVFKQQHHAFLTATLSSLGAINKKHLDKVGFFDERFLGYGLEDSQLTNRLTNIGIKIKVVNVDGYHISHEKQEVAKNNLNIYKKKDLLK